MEKYSQYRDRASGIAPFLPVPTISAGIYYPFHLFLFFIRLPLLLAAILTYFLFLQWLPIGSLGKKASLWLILGVPGIWWIDLQVDGVKKGSLAQQHRSRVPQPQSIIACSSTSPIDALYLAVIFDPIFTASYPSTRLVQPITLFQAALNAFSRPRSYPPTCARLVDLETLVRRHPNRVIAVFPECTTTNGRGILSLSQSLLTAPRTSKIFPINLRYTPPDITTPVPASYSKFLWNLTSQPTHCIRVRIAESLQNTSRPPTKDTKYSESVHDDTASSSDTLLGSEDAEGMNSAEKIVLIKVAEALARLGRVKRVGLGVEDKIRFVNAWSRRRR
ncbi:MAG: hypothetical protein L6R38_007664 [Xanthoria sp. 2 TBL-2021]|nr:MAG: hypothetical protein L6R38_007664 [Xanthoria sp. 2 TBL-2021]